MENVLAEKPEKKFLLMRARKKNSAWVIQKYVVGSRARGKKREKIYKEN